MSWSELERLVDDAESDPVIRRGLRRCRSRREFLLASWRLGYRIQPGDLQTARSLDQGKGGPTDQAGSRSDGRPGGG